ncbi:MAG: GAF domain-containing sensor histidine kinase [Actinoplanes sp.]
MSEDDRLAALHSYGLVDTTRPRVLDDLSRLAASVFGTSMASVAMIDRHRQWLAGKAGPVPDETPRSMSFCGIVVDSGASLVVPDASLHPVYRDWANVTGSPHIRLYAGAPIIDVDGHTLGTMCVLDDVAGEFGDRQLDMLGQLAGQASDHLAAVRERQHLARLGEELARAMSREEELVASVTHELRTPVTTIQGYLEMLTEDDTLSEYRAMIEPIRRNGDRLVRMVEHLLAGALPTETPLTVRPDATDLMAVAEAAISLCRPVAAYRDIQVELRQVGRPELAFGDFDRLCQALEQLLRNAIAFSAPGTEVTVFVNYGAAPRISVVDRGAGIPADELPYVTSRFFRGRHARRAAAPGIGLGLAIAHRIAVAHGGALDITSAGEGAGTSAQVSLPRR